MVYPGGVCGQSSRTTTLAIMKTKYQLVLSSTVGLVAMVSCGGRTSSSPDENSAGGEGGGAVVVDKMISIPAGTFQVGGEAVAIAAFQMDVTEVTALEYQACVDQGACEVAGASDSRNVCNVGIAVRENHPINCVDWSQATAYCAWVAKRLPTAEEWKFAARGTDGRRYPWGDEEPYDQFCWSGGSAGLRNTTCPVGSFTEDKSPFGILDMAGNVDEFASNEYESEGRAFCGYAAWAITNQLGLMHGCGVRSLADSGDERTGFRCAR